MNLAGVSSPSKELADGKPLSASAWSYDSATHTLAVSLGNVPVGRATTVTQVGGSPVRSAEPAATRLTISPASSLVTAPGATTTVSATLANSGPGAADDASLNLSAPAGWTVTPASPTTATSVAAGSSLTASWSVTAPSDGSGQEAATLSATASYTDAATGAAETLTAPQSPTPAITSVSPATASAGQVVTVSGVNFGATQGTSYITFSDDGTNWGAPPDLATFSIGSWSDGKITFTVPSPSGAGGQWHVDPGSTATITVTTASGTSNTAALTIGSG